MYQYDYNDIPFHPVSRFNASRRRIQEASVRFYLRQISRKHWQKYLLDTRPPIIRTEDIDLETYIKRKNAGYYIREKTNVKAGINSTRFKDFRADPP